MINNSEMRKIFINSLFSIVEILVLRVNKFFLQFLVEPLGSGSAYQHIFADSDIGSQNLANSTDPSLKHWSWIIINLFVTTIYEFYTISINFSIWTFFTRIQGAESKLTVLFGNVKVFFFFKLNSLFLMFY